MDIFCPKLFPHEEVVGSRDYCFLTVDNGWFFEYSTIHATWSSDDIFTRLMSWSVYSTNLLTMAFRSIVIDPFFITNNNLVPKKSTWSCVSTNSQQSTLRLSPNRSCWIHLPATEHFKEFSISVELFYD